MKQATFSDTDSLYFSLLCVLFSLSLQMDPIQKAVINHTFGVPLPHRRKQIISCNICQLRFNSDVSGNFFNNKMYYMVSVFRFFFQATEHAQIQR